MHLLIQQMLSEGNTGMRWGPALEVFSLMEKDNGERYPLRVEGEGGGHRNEGARD